MNLYHRKLYALPHKSGVLLLRSNPGQTIECLSHCRKDLDRWWSEWGAKLQTAAGRENVAGVAGYVTDTCPPSLAKMGQILIS
jgi:hypothetical protein